MHDGMTFSLFYTWATKSIVKQTSTKTTLGMVKGNLKGQNPIQGM